MSISRLSIACCLVSGCIASTYCLTIRAADPEVNPAAYTPAQPSQFVGPAVQFSQQRAQVGDFVAQQTAIEMDMNLAITQAGQTASQDVSSLRRRQQRRIEVLEVAEGRVRRARVTFAQSRQQSPENENPNEMEIQPVEGKSYFVTRHGERLIVTDEEGAIPPQDEFEIVLGSVQTLGLPNPLAEFLTKHTIHVGDRLQLPLHLAEQLMGLDDQIGKVKAFELQLLELRQIDGQPCARFSARIAYQGSRDFPMTVNIKGEVDIQTESSRTVAASLAGPLQMEAAERNFQVSAEGSLQVAIQSCYGKSEK